MTELPDIDDGGPAFPWMYTEGHGGMSLRDWFARMALCGMHARVSYDEGLAKPEQRAHIAFIDADAMLKERDK